MIREDRNAILDALQVVARTQTAALRAMRLSDQTLPTRAGAILASAALDQLTSKERTLVARGLRVAVELDGAKERRTRWLQIRLTEEEYRVIAEAAVARGIPISDFARRAMRREAADPGPERAFDSMP
jgi:hypothetical protein